jgi:hypothetical protein
MVSRHNNIIRLVVPHVGLLRLIHFRKTRNTFRNRGQRPESRIAQLRERLITSEHILLLRSLVVYTISVNHITSSLLIKTISQ